MKVDLLSKIQGILEGKVVKGKVIKEEDELTQDQIGDAGVDAGLEGTEGLEGEEGAEEVETLASYVAGVEDILTDEQKEEIKSFIQSKIEAASETGEEGTEGLEGETSGEEEIEFSGEV